MAHWCSVHPSVVQGSHLPQGWVGLLRRNICMDPCPRKRRPLRLRPRVSQPGVSGGPHSRAASVQDMGWLQVTSPWLCLCSGEMSSKVWGFRAHCSLALITELSVGRRCVLSSGTRGCAQSVSVTPLSGPSAEGSLFSPRGQHGQSLGSRTVQHQRCCEGRAAVRPC